MGNDMPIHECTEFCDHASTCGCETRGERKFLCSYHEGYEDAPANSYREDSVDAYVIAKLVDEDIERIAQRVVEMLSERDEKRWAADVAAIREASRYLHSRAEARSEAPSWAERLAEAQEGFKDSDDWHPEPLTEYERKALEWHKKQA